MKVILALMCIISLSCEREGESTDQEYLANVSIGRFTPAPTLPNWSTMEYRIDRINDDQRELVTRVSRSQKTLSSKMEVRRLI